MNEYDNLKKKYEAYIFDIDGTLYRQSMVRIAMLKKMISFFAFHCTRWKELFAVYVFRRMRETVEFQCISLPMQVKVVAEKLHLNEEMVSAVIEKWIMDLPLEAIKKYRYSDVILYIRDVSSLGKQIVFYSDYPAKKKLEKLNLDADYIFSASDDQIGELKPTIKGMNHIMEQLGIEKKRVLYVGDRDEKDGQSAKLVGIDYMDINRFRSIINSNFP